MKTRVIESVRVDVQCSAWVGQFFPDRRCSEHDKVTIVSGGRPGDTVLVPIDWGIEVNHGQIDVFCPMHRRKK